MRIYISGISGTGMGPLALMAKQAGFEVFGSDLHKGAIYNELVEAGCDVFIGEQDGEFLKEKLEDGVDWFVYTSALTSEHPELVLAQEAGIKCTKRDDFTAFLVEKLGLKMVAVAGTHGKTTTTAMIIWAALKSKLPVSYVVGTTLGFAPSGAYHDGDKFFVYEADEYDRNFLKYHPWLAVIPFVSYDHPDIYPTREDYAAAFSQFKAQSDEVIEMVDGVVKQSDGRVMMFKSQNFKLAGEARRADASLAANAVFEMILDEASEQGIHLDPDLARIVNVLNEFPGVGRRFEQIMDGLYTDYAHHPEEIKATVDVALEQAKIDGKKGVVVVYQPHQNTRQYAVRDGYKDAFAGVSKVIWLPTYLTREDANLAVLSAEELASGLTNKDVVEYAEPSDELEKRIRELLNDGYLVVLMTAGPADEWLREKFC
ncbi:hypothetical protein IKT18_03295 [Candidatus Saccharibacteria bacterium]|nr:hypothetical protein [Candidatus Saccharibacteria bacterium]